MWPEIILSRWLLWSLSRNLFSTIESLSWLVCPVAIKNLNKPWSSSVLSHPLRVSLFWYSQAHAWPQFGNSGSGYLSVLSVLFKPLIASSLFCWACTSIWLGVLVFSALSMDRCVTYRIWQHVGRVLPWQCDGTLCAQASMFFVYVIVHSQASSTCTMC